MEHIQTAVGTKLVRPSLGRAGMTRPTPVRPTMPTWWQRERAFILAFLLAVAVGIAVTPYTEFARWFAFIVAAYAAVSNDSVQTLGTFITSNKHRPWWILWLFTGGIFLATAGYSWLHNAGDVSFGRLASKGFEHAPTSLTTLQVLAPLVLVALTRIRVPVSTTFLLLSSMAASSSSVGSVLGKSVGGYVVAALVALFVYSMISRWVAQNWREGDSIGRGWHVAQWVTSGALWMVWITQDAANVAVYLPRKLSLGAFFAFAAFITVGLGVIMWRRGGRIQEVVAEKSRIADVRSATLVDLSYAIILYVFKVQSAIPMSTTWVFVGLLAGRELAMRWRGVSKLDRSSVQRMLARDLGYITFGLVVSFALALCANDALRADLLAQLQ